VTATQEQAKAALEMADHANSIAQKCSDPDKKKKIVHCIEEVKSGATEVVKAGQNLEHNPADPTALQRLENAQAKLPPKIQNLADATMDAKSTGGRGINASELQAAMKELHSIKPAETSVDAAHAPFFALVNATFAEIEALQSLPPGDAKSAAAKAKEISTKTNELAALLRKKAAEIDDPVQKEQLLNTSKVLRDRAMQIKILSAVNVTATDRLSSVSTQSSKEHSSLAKASQGLRSSINDALSALRQAELKQHTKNANSRATAIRKVVQVWTANVNK